MYGRFFRHVSLKGCIFLFSESYSAGHSALLQFTLFFSSCHFSKLAGLIKSFPRLVPVRGWFCSFIWSLFNIISVISYFMKLTLNVNRLYLSASERLTSFLSMDNQWCCLPFLSHIVISHIVNVWLYFFSYISWRTVSATYFWSKTKFSSKLRNGLL